MASRIVMLNGLPGSGKSTLAARLGSATGWPVIAKDVIKECVADALHLPDGLDGVLGAAASEMMWSVAQGLEGTVVVESWFFTPRDRAFVDIGLRRTGATSVVELWCSVPAATAGQRYRTRPRHPVHQDTLLAPEVWTRWVADAVPLALSPTITVDTGGPVDLRPLLHDIEVALSP